MIRVVGFDNISCIKCGKVKKKMVMVGVYHMCEKCFTIVFKKSDPIDPKSERGEMYYHWLDAYKEKV